MPDQPSRKTCGYCLRLSIRALMIVVLIIGGGLGWAVQRAKFQHDAVAAIQRAGGAALYEWEWQNNSPVSNGKPWAPRWLVDRLGVDYFGHVVFVQVYPDHGRADAGEVLSHISRLGRLKILNLFGPSVTDARLACLDGLTSLQELKLNGAKVSGSGLEHLNGLTGLKVLRFEDTPVGDAGLIDLRELSGLKELWLYRTRVTDSGARELQSALPKLVINR